MTERIASEIALLRMRFPGLEILAEGLWCRLRGYPVPGDHWVQAAIDVAFRIPEALPGQQPYAFWVAGGITPRQAGMAIGNYTFPTMTRFAGEWGQFSWAPSAWCPGETADTGDNMVTWVASFARRLQEGP